MKKIIIEVPIYDIDIMVIITDDFYIPNKTYKLELDKDDPETNLNCYYAHTANMCSRLKQVRGRIFMLLKPTSIDYNTISHELFHVITMICQERGIDPDLNNDEPLAYLQGYIGGKIFEFREEYLKSK